MNWEKLAKERAEEIVALKMEVKDLLETRGDLERQLQSACREASTLELGHSKANDAHCLACGFKMQGGANVGLCPKCGSNRWYKTRI